MARGVYELMAYAWPEPPSAKLAGARDGVEALAFVGTDSEGIHYQAGASASAGALFTGRRGLSTRLIYEASTLVHSDAPSMVVVEPPR